MKCFRLMIYILVSVSTIVISADVSFSAPTSVSAEGGSSTQASTTKVDLRTSEQLLGDISSDRQTVSELLGKNDSVLKKVSDRTAIAPKLIPALRKMRADLDELATADSRYKAKVAGMIPEIMAMISVLGDKDSSDKIQLMAKSQDPSEAVYGQFAQFMERWLVADKTVAAQTPLIDDLEKFDKAHNQSIPLTMMTVQLSRDAASADLNQRMLDIATDEMNNGAASAIKQQLAAVKAAKAKVPIIENKPLVIVGSTFDGKTFTSADLKGKVVLVDFWATWCAPCREELPRVKKMYSDYHDKGLAILGVSNDFDIDALKEYTAKENMPWPELFDATAAANHEWNPITMGRGISEIPVMYLIDKKGILRSVTARDNMEELIPKLLMETN